MFHQSNRRAPGSGRSCPDCGGAPVRTTGPALLPGRPPSVQHEPTCPISRAADLAFAADLRWLAERPGVEVRVRRLAPHEAADMVTALGRRVPRVERDRWTVHVHRWGSAGLAREFRRAGVRVAVNVTVAAVAAAGEVR